MGSSLVPSKPAHQWPTDGTVRPRSWHAELPKAKRERVKDGRFLVRFLVLFAFCLGVVATLAWQSYGDAARQMIANTSPRLSWFAPSPASVGEVLPELGLRMAPVGEAILAAPIIRSGAAQNVIGWSRRCAATHRPNRGATSRCPGADDARHFQQTGGGRT
jgi:hypothetical protein